jgi:hypothetical protein
MCKCIDGKCFHVTWDTCAVSRSKSEYLSFDILPDILCCVIPKENLEVVSRRSESDTTQTKIQLFSVVMMCAAESV